MINTKSPRSTRRTKRPRSRALKANSRRKSKIDAIEGLEVVDVVTTMRGKRHRKKVRGVRALVDNKPTAKVTVSLSKAQIRDIDTIPIVKVGNKSYSFTGNRLVSEFKHNSSFRDAIMSGAYFYYNGKLCLYRPDSLKFHGAHVEYADSVIEHPENYLLSRARRVPVPRHPLYNKMVAKRPSGYRAKLHKGQATKLEDVTWHAREYQREENKAEAVLSQAIASTVSRVMGFVNGGGDGPQGTFCEFFSWLMDEKYGVSKKQLSDLTGIDTRTITRMRTETDYTPSLVYIVACCVAMGLLPWECDTLLYLAGYTLRLGNKVERAYITIIHIFAVECTIEQCDEILNKMGVTKLSDVIKKNKKEK